MTSGVLKTASVSVGVPHIIPLHIKLMASPTMAVLVAFGQFHRARFGSQVDAYKLDSDMQVRHNVAELKFPQGAEHSVPGIPKGSAPATGFSQSN